jgi:hypothetical protein
MKIFSILFYIFLVGLSIKINFMVRHHFEKLKLPDDIKARKILSFFRWISFIFLLIILVLLILIIC